MKFGMMVQNGSLERKDRQKFEFPKNQDGGGRPLLHTHGIPKSVMMSVTESKVRVVLSSTLEWKVVKQYYRDVTIDAIKHAVNNNTFVIQQHSAPAHGVYDAV